MQQITCHCGAIYEVIETEDSIRDQQDFKCVLCEHELPWSGYRIPQFHLVKHPETDRE